MAPVATAAAAFSTSVPTSLTDEPILSREYRFGDPFQPSAVASKAPVMVPTISLSVEIAVHSGIQYTLIPLGRKVSQPRSPAPFWTVSVRVGIN